MLIVLEGPEKVGKTTLAAALAYRFESHSFEVIRTHHGYDDSTDDWWFKPSWVEDRRAIVGLRQWDTRQRLPGKDLGAGPVRLWNARVP